MTGAVEYAETLSKIKIPFAKKCPDMTLTIWWWGSKSKTLGNVEYPFIAITSTFTLTRTGSTYYCLSHGSIIFYTLNDLTAQTNG